MPRKSPDLDSDFNIFVDPSCLSAPMDEETALPRNTQDIPTVAEPPVEGRNADAGEAEECNEIGRKDIHSSPSRGHSRPHSAMGDASTVEDTIDGLLEEMQDAGREEGVEKEDGYGEVDTTVDHDTLERPFVDNEESEESVVIEEEGDTSRRDDDKSELHDDLADDNDDRRDAIDGHHDADHERTQDDGYHEEVSFQTDDSYHGEAADDNDGHYDESSHHEDTSMQEEAPAHDESSIYEDETSHTDGPGNNVEHPDDSAWEDADKQPDSRRTSTLSADRRGSLRTEALIQAAARAVVAQIEERAVAAVQTHRDSLSRPDGHDRARPGSASDGEHRANLDIPYDHPSPGRRRSSGSTGSQVRHRPAPSASSGDEAGDSGSHHEAEDDDVFSDRGSARSSLGSSAGGPPNDESVKTPGRHSNEHTARLSGVSSLSQYERDESAFAAPARGRDAPRMPFRTPSDVRAIQMSSPPPSVFSGASPRSGKRGGAGGASAQYSPRGRGTPPRFKMRKEAPPLVLLHVTLLPLRWVWGGVVDGLDGVVGEGGDGFEASDELKSLRDAWRQLRDRVGDTVLERGILLPHPQNDYEVLEERLLEALELPLRRRARILECGHYLGPANEMVDEEESESEDEYGLPSARFQRGDRRHWCSTCKGDVKYEDLGPGRIFRVKVYASNGLMKAGAWAACWKEMERVDIEVEPIVETALHRELERLAAFQIGLEERHQRELEDEHQARQEEQLREEAASRLPAIPQAYSDERDPISSPLPAGMHASPPSPFQPSSPVLPEIDASEARRRRDEARLREIYGLSPPLEHLGDTITSSMHAEPSTSSFPSGTHDLPLPEPETSHTSSTYMHPPSPRSPSEEAAERRTQRRTGTYQGASLAELVVEAVKVLMRDRKNVAIAVLGVFVLLLAMRPGREVDVSGYRVGPVVRGDIMADVAGMGSEEGYGVRTVVVGGEVPVVAVSVSQAPEKVAVTDVETQIEASSASETPGSVSSIVAAPETVTEKKVVRIVETVTETMKVSVTATESVVVPRATETAVVQETETRTVEAAQATQTAVEEDLGGAMEVGLEMGVCALQKLEDVCFVGRNMLASVFEAAQHITDGLVHE